jgi:hypothetical protein
MSGSRYGFGVSCPRCGGQPCWRAIKAAALLEAHALRAEIREKQSRGRRFPWQPVEDVLRARTMAYQDSNGVAIEAGMSEWARIIGVDRRSLYKYKRAGFSELMADRVAGALGLNPLSLWPDYYEPEAVSAA